MKRLLLIAAVVLTSVVGASAQSEYPERYGVDPAKREDNARMLNYMQHSYRSNSYDDALSFFRKLIVEAPKASMNMYIWASDIYRGKLARATTKAERQIYLDTILMVFDKRIENFGDHEKYGAPYLTAQKALIFNETDPTNHKKAFDLFRKAVEVGAHEVDPDLVSTFFNSLTESFKLDDITPEEYILDYEKLTTILTDINGGESHTKAIANIEALFASSGAASCENIERIFRPKYEADQDNAVLVKQVLSLFSRSKCSSEFQLALTEKYYKIEPTADLAAMLANIYSEKKDFVKSNEYMKVAIAGEKDPNKKVLYLLSAASSSLGAGQYREAADFARQAISVDEAKASFAYLILAEAYAGGVRACSGFDLQAAYWLVVDAYTQARTKLADQPGQVESINKMIGTYSSNFPRVEDTFQRDLKPGQGYTVNCGWVSGRTTVRER